MPKLRRTSRSAHTFPIQAEVLEIRSFLSSATAVAHRVQHDLAPHVTQTIDFSGARTGHLSASIFGAFTNVAETFTANFTTGTSGIAVGGHLKATFSAPINAVHNGYTIVSMSGHVSGKLTSSFFEQTNEVFFVHSTSSVTLNVVYQGKALALKIAPKGGVTELRVSTAQHQFVSLLGKYELPKKIFDSREFIFNFS